MRVPNDVTERKKEFRDIYSERKSNPYRTVLPFHFLFLRRTYQCMKPVKYQYCNVSKQHQQLYRGFQESQSTSLGLIFHSLY